jgi:RHS repeat-associated protein
LPFGETMAQQLGSNYYNSPFKFNGKELDEETGFYYYGARYYDPKISIWLSVDPLAEEFPEWSPYSFCFNNPLSFIDPDGMAPMDIIILGKNNSSVTLKTDLIDIKVNASSLGVDFGGKYTLQGESIVSAGLDIVGILDPTGVADGLNAGLQAKNGDWWGAGISALGVVPYIGDVAKVGKIGKDVKIIENAIDVAKSEKKVTGSYTVTFESGKKYHGKGPESRMNKSAADKAKVNIDPVKSKDFTSAKNDREAFKQESRRMDTDRVGNTPGHKNPNNYNKRASPGDKYRKQDKE